MGMISKIYGSTSFGVRGVYEPIPERTPVMTWDNSCYVVYGSYHIRKKLKIAGFLYDPNRKAWYTDNLEAARKFRKYADFLAKAALRG